MFTEWAWKKHLTTKGKPVSLSGVKEYHTFKPTDYESDLISSHTISPIPPILTIISRADPLCPWRKRKVDQETGEVTFEECKRKPKAAGDWARHFQSHLKDLVGKTMEFECPVCGKGFARYDSFKRHAMPKSRGKQKPEPTAKTKSKTIAQIPGSKGKGKAKRDILGNKPLVSGASMSRSRRGKLKEEYSDDGDDDLHQRARHPPGEDQHSHLVVLSRPWLRFQSLTGERPSSRNSSLRYRGRST
ncbi:hypothetical protein SISNIDRAFT_456168 [Sistotremastrum niveocremeum HHB9708]|uniref:C2H2-type domain-containing protein n=1 Tax=Sistotremastrum niveocremeum HHB9708 TaxID=1314777 RepID=A0A164T125_9AGAM|nr:hypothetical protein SISNIDRAFT_456168 [Sistotremastrum niveocremeum HHB9708]